MEFVVVVVDSDESLGCGFGQQSRSTGAEAGLENTWRESGLQRHQEKILLEAGWRYREQFLSKELEQCRRSEVTGGRAFGSCERRKAYDSGPALGLWQQSVTER